MTEAERQAAADIRAVMGNQQLRVVEKVEDAMPAFEQASHTLMLEGVDKIAEAWLAELARIREQTIVLEQMVLAQCARVKDHVTRMHLLGVQTMREAQRTNDVNKHIADELDKMMDNQDA